MNRAAFESLATTVSQAVPAGMTYALYASGERSDFVRFNHAQVRQPGSVVQGNASVRLLQGKRHASTTVALTGDAAQDAGRLTDALGELAGLVPELPEDPHLLLPSEVNSTQQVVTTEQASPEAVIETVCSAGEGTDLVGIYAGGTLWRGFANSAGQRNWFESGSWLFDYSLVVSADKAIKRSVGGASWDANAVRNSIALARQQLDALARPSRTIEPGSYRAWLEPAAVAELVEMMGMDGFAESAHQVKASLLQRLGSGEVTLDARVQLTEDTAASGAPVFNSDGFIKPDAVPLVREGRPAERLVSPRSAGEYGVQPNGAGRWEHPAAVAMAPGELDPSRALRELGTGIFVSNLWYLNISDRNAARLTGMTRFATFWVEDGQLVAPLNVMRFDASVYDLFGEDLHAIGSNAAFMPSASTYTERSTGSVRVPGMLVKALPFTL